MRRLATLFLIGGAITMSAASADAQIPHGVISVEGYPEGQTALPTSVQVDLADLAQSLGVQPTGVDDIFLALETQGGPAPVAWQAVATPSGDAIVSFLPPADARESPLRVRMYLGRHPEVARLPSPGAVEVSEADGAFTVRNEFYEVTHTSGAMGGLPSRIVWRGSGKVFDTFALNDRLYGPDLGGFLLRNDDSAEVQALARGPLAAVIRVSARYIGNGATPSNARAEYLFHYFAGSPVVRIEAHVTQDAAMEWNECHLLEINFPDESFTRWVSAESPEGGDLVADKTLHSGAWCGLLDGDSVLGMFGRDAARIYDGRGDYGTYLHGPWVRLAAENLALSTNLYINSAQDGAAQLAQLAEANADAVEYELTTSVIEALLADIEAGRKWEGAWVASLVAQQIRSGSLAESTAKLRAVGEALEAGRDPIRAIAGEGPERLHVLAGDRLVAGIRTSQGGASLASIYDIQARRECLRSDQPLWRATFRDGDGERIALTSESGFSKVRFAPTKGGARLRWAQPLDDRLAGVALEQRVSVDGAALSATLRVDNASSASLLDVTPLTLDLARLGGSRTDDWVLYPKVSGGLVRDPMASFPGHSGRYPSGWTTAQFGAFYDSEGGLYFGCHDPLAWAKEIRVEAAGGGVDARMLWHAEDASLPGNGFTQSGATVIRLFDGDWFDATRIYRSWAEAEASWWPDADRADTPEWMKDIAVWVIDNGHAKDCVPRVKRFAEYMGVPTALHWYSWHKIPFDVDYPHYFPTKPGFAEGVAELQEAGVRVMPYINGRLWDTASEDFKSVAFPSAAKKEDGENYIEEYGSGAKLAPMCPTTELWRNTVRDLVLRLCGPENNVDGVYIDQVAAAAPAICYDRNHGHPLGGGSWWTEGGYWQLLAQLREDLRALSPEKMITTECTAEPYAHRFDGYLSWNFWYGDQAPVIAALYGGRIQLFGRTAEGGDQAVRVKTAQALAWGEQVGWYHPGVIDHPVNGPFIRRCARMRYLLRDFLANGRMEHPPTISGDVPSITSQWRGGEATYPAIQAGAWSSRDGRLAVIFANALDEALTFSWQLDGRYYAFDADAVVYSEDGTNDAERPRLRTPGNLEITLDPCDVVAFVIDRFEERGP